MKRFIKILFSLFLIVGSVACGHQNQQEEKEKEQEQNQQQTPGEDSSGQQDQEQIREQDRDKDCEPPCEEDQERDRDQIQQKDGTSSSFFMYTVVKGDTLWSISERYDVTVSRILNCNHLTSSIITVGQVLKIPGDGTEVPTPTPVPSPPTVTPSVMIFHGNLNRPQIALTFDAGSDIAGIDILDVLKKHGVKATFFLTGKWVEKFPAYAKRIVADGHEIANHSYSHPHYPDMSQAAIVSDLQKAEVAIKSATGKSSRTYFRFPYGDYNKASLTAVGLAGYPTSIQWSLDTIDWKQPEADVIVERILTNATNGDIVLMHIGGINTPEAVDKAIPQLQAKGYSLVTISQILQK